MRLGLKSPWTVLGMVVAWRLLLLLLTAQPVPANDAFLFDGAIVNWLLHGQYVNPSLAQCFPISGHEVFAAYPPIYQALLLPWMWLFGTSALSAMWFHLFWFSVAGVLLVMLLQTAGFLERGSGLTGLALLFLLAVTFDDRPEGLAHVFGLLALVLTARRLRQSTGESRTKTSEFRMGIAVVVALFCSLYTSLVVGAFYCGVTILSRMVAWVLARRPQGSGAALLNIGGDKGNERVREVGSDADKAYSSHIAGRQPGQLASPALSPSESTNGVRTLASPVEVLAAQPAAYRMPGPGLPWGIALGVVALFGAATVWIADAHPVWWQGFLENARQTPVSTTGFRLPQAAELIKVVRNAPVFLVALLFAPALLRRRVSNRAVALALAILGTGWVLLAGTLTLFTANYVIYLWDTQVVLAAALIELAPRLQDGRRDLLYLSLGCCLALVSVRAAGMTSWGAICATDVNYSRAQSIVRQELQPFVTSGGRPIVSSAFLYEAARLGVRRAIHADWPYDRRGKPQGSDLDLMSRLRPPKLVLTQFDYYRVYAPLVAELARHPELCSVRISNTARVRAPDSFASLQRALQHVSWAPVIINLEWKR